MNLKPKYDTIERLKKIALFFMAGLILITCKKEPLPQSAVNGQPVFSFAGKIGSDSLKMLAGVNNYYMYSSCSQDSVTGVYSFMGTLQSATPNTKSIEFIINDDTAVGIGTPSNINMSVSPSILYSFYLPGANIDTTGYSVKFIPVVIEGTPTSYSYIFGDGGTSSAVSPTHTYTTMSTYNTSLAITFASCGIITITNPINIVKKTNPLTINSISSSIKSKSITLDTTKINLSAAVIGGTAPYSYSWSLGDSHSSTSATFTDTYVDTTHLKPTYSCSLLITDNAHNSISYNAIISDTIEPSICLFDYTMSAPKPVIIITNPYLLSNVTVVYNDGLGNIYKSQNGLQQGSTFKVISVSNYKNNSSNQATKMLKITFDCNVYIPGNPVPTAISGTAIIAVAYQ